MGMHNDNTNPLDQSEAEIPKIDWNTLGDIEWPTGSAVNDWAAQAQRLAVETFMLLSFVEGELFKWVEENANGSTRVKKSKAKRVTKQPFAEMKNAMEAIRTAFAKVPVNIRTVLMEEISANRRRSGKSYKADLSK